MLSAGAEEVATFFAKMLDHEYTTKDVFRKNFFKDWRKVRSGSASTAPPPSVGALPFLTSDCCQTGNDIRGEGEDNRPEEVRLLRDAPVFQSAVGGAEGHDEGGEAGRSESLQPGFPTLAGTFIRFASTF